MKYLVKSLSLIVAVISFVSCSKDQDKGGNILPAKTYQEQTPKEIAEIEKFFVDYNMKIDNDKNVFFTKLTPGLKSIKEEYNPKFKMVKYNNYDFKVYYINHSGEELKTSKTTSPCPIDSIMVHYKGFLLKEKTPESNQVATNFNETQTFTEANYNNWSILSSFIPGWYNMISLMTPGERVLTQDNQLTFKNYSSAVFFFPSGLAYFSKNEVKIPAYSPLIFNIKLLAVKNIDSDGDGVKNKEEQFIFDYNIDIPWKGISLDTDLDGIANVYDIDDDNDGILTKKEITFIDTDLDGILDYLDDDDDNDGVLTRDEFDGDDNNDGIPNYRDSKSKRSKK